MSGKSLVEIIRKKYVEANPHRSVKGPTRKIPTERMEFKQMGYAELGDLIKLQNKNKIIDFDTGVRICCEHLKKLPLHFGKVNGEFVANENNIKSLYGAPTFVNESFFMWSNELTSLEFGPEIVGDCYDCSDNNLKSLKGAPLKIPSEFNCSSNLLKTLEGGPVEAESYMANNNFLTSLKGAPVDVATYFEAICNKITSLEGAPRTCYDLTLSDNKISSLRNVHKHIDYIGGHLDLSRNPIVEGGIGLLLIEGLTSISFQESMDYWGCCKAFDIISKYLGLGSDGLLRCQEELIEAGLEAYAIL